MKLIPEKDCPELQRHPDSGVWYYRKYVTGKGEFFKSTKERKSKSRAKAIGMRMFAEWMGTPEAFRKAALLFDDIAREVIGLKAIKSPRTLVSARAHIEKHLMPFFGGHPIDRITEAHWEQYIVEQFRLSPGRKLFNDRKHLIMVMRHAYKKGVITRQHTFRNPDSREKKVRAFTDDEMARLEATASGDLLLQIGLAFKNGMRRGEILGLRIDQIDIGAEIITLEADQVKTRRGRVFPIHPDLLPAICARVTIAQGRYLFQGKGDASVIDNKTAWRRCKRAAGVVGRFHDLRHTFMSWGLYKYKLQLSHLCAISGMSIVVAERVYLHYTPGDLRETLKAFRGISGNISSGVNKNNELRGKSYAF